MRAPIASWRRLGATVMALGASVCAMAQSPSGSTAFVRSGFTVFSGDVNGDGYTDILVKAKRQVVIIPIDDLSIPIAIPTPVKSFVIVSDGNGHYSLSTNPNSAILNASVWQAGTYDLRLGDILGNGAGGAIIEARNAGSPSFSVAISSGLPQLIQTLTADTLGFDLSASGVTSELSDRNGDGRTDLTIRRGAIVLQVLYANASGLFIADQEATLRAVWLGFKSHLDTGDASSALAYISPASAPYYSEIFQAFGGDRLRTLSATWTDVKAIALRPKYATFSIVDTFNGVRSVHIIVFEKDGDHWVLTSL
jgi:hypothetical protein